MGAKAVTVSEETSIAELLGLAVAMFSLSEEKCFDSDREINALKVCEVVSRVDTRMEGMLCVLKPHPHPTP